MTTKKIIILGGGVAGLSTAHELVERSGQGVDFDIHVFEKRNDFVGGKARSTPVFTSAADGTAPSPFTDVRVGAASGEWTSDGVHALPGEHGFRFFPGFYRHLPDTMKHIPITPEKSVFDNLVVAENLLLARFGVPNFVMPTGVPLSFDGFLNAVKDLYTDRNADLGLTTYQLETFAEKLWRILTSCDGRRMEELEPQTWWDYLEVGKPGLTGAYESFLAEGLSRSLLANNPRVASARTVGNTNIQLIYDVVDPDRNADRLLNGPTSMAWLTPWRKYLTEREGVSVHLHMNSDVKSIELKNGVVSSAKVIVDGAEQSVTGDYFVGALPVERMAELLEASPAVLKADEKLSPIVELRNSVGRMYGLQFFLTRDVPIVNGHTLYIDSPWALVSISEVQFWKDSIDISKCDDGKVRGLLSVCISEWKADGIDGAPPAEESPSRVALVAQVWEQLKAAINKEGDIQLNDTDLHAWYVDEDVNFVPNHTATEDGREPLFINEANDWFKRPQATTGIKNFFLASDYVQTYTDVACMEAANEAARRATNGILKATGSKAQPAELFPLEEPEYFAPYKAADQIRFDKGLPWIGKSTPQISPYPAPTAKFVERSAEQCHLQPFTCDGITLFGFFMRGDQAQMQKFIDKYLNASADGAVDYRVLSDMILVSFADVRKGTSTQPPDSHQGYIPELSTTFWIPTAAYENDEPVRLAQFVPYIIVDNAWSAAAGREIYGFPKEIGMFVLPTDPATAKEFEVSTTVIEKFSPDSLAKMMPLLNIRQTNDGEGILSHLRSWLHDAEAGLEALYEIWGDGIGSTFLKSLIADAVEKELPAVFLKQFRDAADGRLACYQAIIETDIVTSDIRDVGFLKGTWACQINTYDSHPIRQDLGLPASGDIECILPFHVDMDFVAGSGREIWRATPPAKKKKIAVLGGGVGAMTTVFELTEQENWADRYEITVYQMGWRLGGKGASGRNGDDHERIEEHGLHLWFGYYHNAFDVMRRAYAANGRPKDAPLATVEQAFKPHGEMTVSETNGTDWNMWNIDLPMFPDDMPGADADAGIGDYFTRMIGTLITVFEDHMPDGIKDKPVGKGQHHGLIDTALGLIGNLIPGLDLDNHHPDVHGLAVVHHLLKAHGSSEIENSLIEKILDTLGISVGSILRRLAEFALKIAEGVFAPWVEMAIDLLRDAEKLEHELGFDAWEVRRFASLLELGLVNMRGIVDYDVIEKGFAPLNVYDYREWLALNGGTELSIDSDLIRIAYETIFAFEDGDTSRPNLAAGSAAYGLMRLCFGWKGAVMWKMQAGMGDTVFSPIYEVLKKRGVKFKFFNKVENLGLDASKSNIESIQMTRQVAIKGGADYQPLRDVNGLPCWPSRPLFDQIVDGEVLKKSGANLESHWCQWPDDETYTMRRGVDFDEVVLGISIGALPQIAAELISSSPDWQSMIKGVPTVQTQAFQMWMKPDLPHLGWPVPDQGDGPNPVWDSPRTPVLGGYAQPQNTWADMSHLIPREVWKKEAEPGSVAYFCGPMAGPAQIPAKSDVTFPFVQNGLAKGYALQWVRDNITGIWSEALRTSRADGMGGFHESIDWSLLIDTLERDGPARFDAQYWRANVDPSERYALTPKNGVMDRIASGDTGFGNLVMAGDWTKNGLDIGCVEAATTSGLDAARALMARLLAERYMVQ